MKEKVIINAMMEDDMKATLKKWGYWDNLVAGKIKCPCGETVTEENLAAIKPVKGKVIFLHSIICNSL